MNTHPIVWKNRRVEDILECMTEVSRAEIESNALRESRT